ncbi:alpha/beta fold hydrolase [Spirosoma endophyticum]|uniref:Pimeloyl-ACP methyl ester carboxylesterase n=1 Tax=Spirosoma endophyticum TaxID=662367 RepID=A0A1I1WDE9_9BACT|nr:alpha/beta hydrolase [Spirosoma endophyticum]SFD93174.1 Pimeloyl-ACP methyl ester carboxylesterase [Spirosoma endophyticum]
MTHTFVKTNNIQLHVVQAGPADGPLVILLHGFPEFWYGWQHQIDTLAEAGFFVWAPDQRGYNLSDKPTGVDAYGIDTLAADVVGLIDAAGRQKAIVVGHDWGAAVAWWTAVTYPERVDRLVVMNVPHPIVMKKFASRDLGQMLRSWYIGFFQLPWLPETLSRLGNWAMLVRTLRKSSRPGTFSNADLQQYKAAWSQPGAFTAMVNWYRAALQKPPSRRSDIRITVPTLLIWGVRDQFLKREMAQLSIDLCDNGRIVFIENATHWVQHEEAERVNELIKSIVVSQ